MATKLFPPTIDGKLPAAKMIGGSKAHLEIPFEHNIAIGDDAYKGFYIKIKTASTNLLIGNIISVDKSAVKNNLISIDIEGVQTGQFYKAQIAYWDQNNEAGMYSSVGVFKCTIDAEPNISIVNILGMSVMGSYTPLRDDYTEVEYSYNFKLYDDSNNLIVESGEILHNSQDNANGADSYTFGKILSIGTYILKYNVTTINKSFIQETLEFTIQQKVTSNLLAPTLQMFKNNSGAIKITSKSLGPKIFLLRNDGIKWEILSKNEENISNYVFIDNTVEQGIVYSYRFCSEEKTAGTEVFTIDYGPIEQIESDYEAIQLSDENKWLSISFNPKVNSFKDTIQEQKLDTIGGQFPFFFRNGNVKYKEIGISGLISYHMDENNLFLQNSDIGLSNETQRENTNAKDINLRNRTTQLTSYNVAAERKFREAVVAWLTNGQPKLLRSPTEGNYIVRLMNVTLSPSDQLGRLLYTFSATAYQIADFNLDKLNEYNLIWGEKDV